MGIFQNANLLLKLENIIHTVPVTVCGEIKMVAASITSRNVQFFQVRVSNIKPSKYRNCNMKEGSHLTEGDHCGCLHCQAIYQSWFTLLSYSLKFSL